MEESKKINCVNCGKRIGAMRLHYKFKTCTHCRLPSDAAAEAKYAKTNWQLSVIKVFERKVRGEFKGYIADERFHPPVDDAFVCAKDIADASTEQRNFQFEIAADLNKDYPDHKFVVVVKK